MKKINILFGSLRILIALSTLALSFFSAIHFDPFMVIPFFILVFILALVYSISAFRNGIREINKLPIRKGFLRYYEITFNAILFISLLMAGISSKENIPSTSYLLLLIIIIIILRDCYYLTNKKRWFLYFSIIAFCFFSLIFFTNHLLSKKSVKSSFSRKSNNKQNEQLIFKQKQYRTNSTAIKKDSTLILTPGMKYGKFAISATGKKSFIYLENNLIRLKISTEGGKPYTVELKEYKNYKGNPLILFDGDSTVFGFAFFSENRIIFTNELFFKSVSSDTLLIAKDSPQKIVLRLYAGEDNYIEYEYSLAPDSYEVEFQANFINMSSIVDKIRFFDFNWEFFAPRQEKNQKKENRYTSIAYRIKDKKVCKLREKGKVEEMHSEESRIKWIAFKGQFFSSIIIAEDHFDNCFIQFKNLADNNKHLKKFKADIECIWDIQEPIVAYTFNFYFGPNHYSTMKKYGHNLEKMISFLQRWFFSR